MRMEDWSDFILRIQILKQQSLSGLWRNGIGSLGESSIGKSGLWITLLIVFPAMKNMLCLNTVSVARIKLVFRVLWPHKVGLVVQPHWENAIIQWKNPKMKYMWKWWKESILYVNQILFLRMRQWVIQWWMRLMLLRILYWLRN